MVARIGGEEFAVAAVVDSAQQGYLLAEKIRHGWSRSLSARVRTRST